jgi:hypothetical protein
VDKSANKLKETVRIFGEKNEDIFPAEEVK